MRRVYWGDARFDSISTANYDGSDVHEVGQARRALQGFMWLSYLL